MKHIASLFLSLLTILAFTSCEKETVLSVDQTSITIPDTGGTQTVSLTANKVWTASSNQSWCKVSPSGGEEVSSSRITITCDANTSYDARNASVTFTCAEKTVSVNVSQATNDGLLVSQTEYNITNAAQQLNIEVKANVKFIVEVDNGCKDWVKYNTTKGLTNSTVVLDISNNEAYDGREGKVTIKQTDGNLSATVVIKQDQVDGLLLTKSEYFISSEKQNLTIVVSTNISFDVISAVDWIKHIETKGLNTKQIVLEIQRNDSYDLREGLVTVKQKNGNLSYVIKVSQQGQSLTIKKILYSDHWGGGKEEEVLVYDESGRITKTWNSSRIKYTEMNDSTIVANIEDGTYHVELSIVNNLCVFSKTVIEGAYGIHLDDVHTTTNTYFGRRLKVRETTGSFPNGVPYQFEEDFVWDNDNLVSWVRTSYGSTYNTVSNITYEYYDYYNPWTESLFDFSSAYLLEDDWDDLPMELFFGFTGLHSKNLLKASYRDGILYQTFEYTFDSKGRISKVTVRRDRDYSLKVWGMEDTREFWYVYELIY